MRHYSEKCLRNLQDRMIVFGFEGWDIFLVLGTALILQIVKVNNLVVWAICGILSGFLILVKRGKPANASEHYMDWFFKDKRFTAYPQEFIHTIKGRQLDFLIAVAQKSVVVLDILIFGFVKVLRVIVADNGRGMPDPTVGTRVIE